MVTAETPGMSPGGNYTPLLGAGPEPNSGDREGTRGGLAPGERAMEAGSP